MPIITESGWSVDTEDWAADLGGAILRLSLEPTGRVALAAQADTEFIGPFRKKVLDALRGNEAIERVHRLQAQQAGAKRTVALAEAGVAEALAKRQQLTVETPAGLGKLLQDIDAELPQLREKAARARADADSLEPLLQEAKTAAEGIVREQLGRMGQEESRLILESRAPILRDLLGAMAPHWSKLVVRNHAAIALLSAQEDGPAILSEMFKSDQA
jgi:hypothetical protein